MKKLEEAFRDAVLRIERLVGEQVLAGKEFSDDDLLDAHHVAAMMDGLRAAIEAERAGGLIISESERKRMLIVFEKITHIQCTGAKNVEH